MRTPRREQEATLRCAQESAFRRLPTADWEPDSDDQIRIRLEEFKRRVNRWSRANISVDKLHSVDDKGKIRLQNSINLIASSREHDVVDSLYHGSLNRQIVHIILSSLAITTFYKLLFKSPFVSLQSRKPPIPNAAAVEGLDTLLSKFMKGNTKESLAWRSQTMRLLKPRMAISIREGERGWSEKTREATQDSERAVIEKDVSEFLKNKGCFFIEIPDTARVVKELKDRLLQIIGTCSNLQIQKRLIQVWGGGEIRDHEPKFHYGSTLLEPHRIHDKEDETGPEGLKGR